MTSRQAAPSLRTWATSTSSMRSAVVGAMAYGCAAQMHQDHVSALRPEMLLSRLNQAIWSTTRGKFTMSCFAAIIDTKESQLTFASGAHAFPLLFRARDQQKPFIPLVAAGSPLAAALARSRTSSDNCLISMKISLAKKRWVNVLYLYTVYPTGLWREIYRVCAGPVAEVPAISIPSLAPVP